MRAPRQPEVNIGLVGHVDHGKTTLTQALTGEWTDRHSEELRRGISIKLGYADAAFYNCTGLAPPAGYSTQPECPEGGGPSEFLRAVSFVDAPGHETLMATMLSGAAIMDGALLLVAANEKVPQPQTREHLYALDIIGVRKVVVVQNKIDLLSPEEAVKNYEEIVEFLKGSPIEGAPIVPISANHRVNIDALIGAIQATIPTPARDPDKPPLMYVARSFDINRPGTRPPELRGGVMGGSLLQGHLKVGEEIEIRPGIANLGEGRAEALHTEITALVSGGIELDELGPAGSRRSVPPWIPPSPRATASRDGSSAPPGPCPRSAPRSVSRSPCSIGCSELSGSSRWRRSGRTRPLGSRSGRRSPPER